MHRSNLGSIETLISQGLNKLVTLAITFADTEEVRIKIGFDLAPILVSATNPILLTEIMYIECGLKKPTKTYY